MKKLEYLDKNLEKAYLNFTNDDLEKTLQILGNTIKKILKNDVDEEDIYWQTLTIYVFNAAILNSFYNNIEINAQDFTQLLDNEIELKRNVKEFCYNFAQNETIDFISNIEDIKNKNLKEVIKIIKENLNSNEEIDDKNSIFEKTIKITETYNGKTNTTIYPIKPDILNIIKKAKTTSGEEKVIFAFTITNIENDKITIKTSFPMSMVINDQIDVLSKKTTFDIDLKKGLIISTINPRKNYQYHLTIVDDTNDLPEPNKEILTLKNKIPNIFETWNNLKNENEQLKDFFEKIEKEALKELINNKNKVTINDKKLADLVNENELNCKNLETQLIISYFGYQSIHDINFTMDEKLPCEEMSIDNIDNFRAVLIMFMVNIIDKLYPLDSPLNIKLIFSQKKYVDIFSAIINNFLPKIFPDINEIKIVYK